MRVLCVLTALVALCPIYGQDLPKKVPVFGRGYDTFRDRFAHRELTLGTVEEFQRFHAASDKWIVVALGDVSKLPNPNGGWRRFVDNGATLLIASDHGNATVAGEFGVAFHARPVTAPPNVPCYPEFPDCPLLTRFTRGSPLFVDVGVLALNRSGWLEVPFNKPEHTAAVLPPGTTGPLGQNLTGKPVVYGAAFRNGRALFAADHSLFVNETMFNHDEGLLNLPFADNVVDWLIAGRIPQELRVLFFIDGRPIDQWIDPRFITGDWPVSTFDEKLQTLDTLLRAVNRMILTQQERRDPETGLAMYNQAVRNWESRQRPGSFLKAVLWGLTAFIAMSTLAWLLGRRARPPEPAPAPPADGKPNAPPPYGPKAEDDPLQRSLLDRRRIEMLEEGHYVDLARRLSRVWLTQQLGAPPTRDYVVPPPLQMGSDKLRTRWREAWLLATDADHAPMSLSQFQRFRGDLANIQQMLDRGRRASHAVRS